MAQTAHLFLKVNGEDVKGESSQESDGKKDSIEVTYFESEVMTAREVQTGQATGRRQHKPLLIRKPVDKSSPLIAKALTKNSKVEGEIKFYRPNPTGDGTTEHFFTVKIANGRVGSQKLINVWTRPGEPHSEAMQEEVTFVFQEITWTYVNGGIEHIDSWNAS